jgi:hypothetical protein
VSSNPELVAGYGCRMWLKCGHQALAYAIGGAQDQKHNFVGDCTQGTYVACYMYMRVPGDLLYGGSLHQQTH